MTYSKEERAEDMEQERKEDILSYAKEIIKHYEAIIRIEKEMKRKKII